MAEQSDVGFDLLQSLGLLPLLAGMRVLIQRLLEIGVEQLILFVLDALALSGQGLQFGFGFGHQVIETGADEVPQLFTNSGWDREPLVVGGHEVFHVFDPDCLEQALGFALLPA